MTRLGLALLVAAFVASAVAAKAPASAPSPAKAPPVPPPPAEPTYVMSLEPGFPRVRFTDGQASLNDRCIVKANRLNTMIHPVYVNGMPVAFCCASCPAVFSTDPDPWLKKQKIRVQDPLDKAKPAVISHATRCFLGHDVFYFSGSAALEKFKRSPLTYSGPLTDPVTRERFKPSTTSPHVVYNGRDYYFQNPATRARFDSRPDSFAVRQGV